MTLTCRRQSGLSGALFWIRLVVGSFPEVVAATYTFDGSSVCASPRFKAEQEPGTFVLYITKSELSDAAFYYCEQVIDLQTTLLNKTFLSITGKRSEGEVVNSFIIFFYFKTCISL